MPDVLDFLRNSGFKHLCPASWFNLSWDVTCPGSEHTKLLWSTVDLKLMKKFQNPSNVINLPKPSSSSEPQTLKKYLTTKSIISCTDFINFSYINNLLIYSDFARSWKFVYWFTESCDFFRAVVWFFIWSSYTCFAAILVTVCPKLWEHHHCLWCAWYNFKYIDVDVIDVRRNFISKVRMRNRY